MDKEFLTIGSFSNLAEAELIQNKLEMAGIESVISDHSTAYIDPAMNSYTGPVDLIINKSDLEKARKILESQAQAEG